MSHSALQARATAGYLLTLLFPLVAFAQQPSVCFGTAADGRLENGRKLPARGNNFLAYSTLGRMLGRTYVHSTVHAVMLDAYHTLEVTTPGRVYVYGETGKKRGGEFGPHKTHRNGSAVDFMVPVVDANGKSVPLPTHVLNKWGYELEFDAAGKLDDMTIDFNAIAEHLYALHHAALRHGIDIDRVIFDPELQPLLHGTSRWSYLNTELRFSTRRSWVRHDEHYHVDFRLTCRSK